MALLAVGDKKKSADARLGEYGGWSITLMDLAAMNSFLHQPGSLGLEILQEGPEGSNKVLRVDFHADGHVILVDEAFVVEEADYHLFFPARLTLELDRGSGAL